MTYQKIAAALLLAGAISGCSTSGGMHAGNTNYAFPNSNITPIKTVSYSEEKMVIGVPKITAADMQRYKDKALEQAGPDADILIDYTLDTNTTILLPFVQQLKITLRGTAAKMEVGRQYLDSEKKLKNRG